MHTILSRGFAGSERTVAQMANVQSEKHDVTVVLKRSHRDRNGVSITQWIDRRVRIVEVGNWLTRRDLARAIATHAPDVIHAHLRRSTRLLARIQPAVPTVVTLHITVNGPYFAAMDGIICIARWQHEHIPPDYRGRVFDIKPGYVRHPRLAPSQVEALRATLGVRPHDFLIGGVGRLTPKKGFDVLIEAFRRAALPDAKLVILGEGRERKRLQRMSSANVVLPGFRAQIKDYYQAFDLFVCPSRAEPFGFVLLEALDAGVPVAASDALGPAEVLANYPGRLFPVGDVAALADILRYYHDARLPKTPQDLSPYAIDVVAAQTEAAYEELIAARKCRRADCTAGMTTQAR